MSGPRRTRRKPLIPEHALQVSVLHYMHYNAAPDVYWFAVPNAGRRTPWAGSMLKREGMTRGVADLCIMLPGGKVAWLEFKSAEGSQSEAQRYFQERCKRLSHPYAVVHSYNEAVGMLGMWGALKKGHG